MPTVRFSWSPLVLEVRRETCPKARWIAAQRAWAMSAADAQAFLAAAHERLNFARCHAEVAIDDQRWMIGFVHGAPFVQEPGATSRSG